MSKLINPFSYSFKDLIKASKYPIEPKTLYSMSQPNRNIEVKKMYKLAGWFWEDIIGNDGISYTAFSPQTTSSNCSSSCSAKQYREMAKT